MGEQTALQKEMTKLQTLLENESTSPDEVKKQLTAVRQAREKAKQELAAAQQDLKQILTVKQEALLVTMGMLD
jgi:Spy/CpxP family protein refolding chaperone